MRESKHKPYLDGVTEQDAARAYRRLSEKDKAVIRRQQKLLASELSLPTALAVVAAVGMLLLREGE